MEWHRTIGPLLGRVERDTVLKFCRLPFGISCRPEPRRGGRCSLAQRIAVNPGLALRMAKKLLREGQTVSLATYLETAASLQALSHKTRQDAEAVTAFLEKRPPHFIDE